MDKLFRLTGFVPFIAIVFLNAFVDLGHLVLLQNTLLEVYDGHDQILLTALTNGLVLLPFLLLLSPAGFLSDRYRKPEVMRFTAAAAVVLTLLITLAYYAGWFGFAFALTPLLAVQTAIYSPAKYGYLRELAGKERLAAANGVVQAVMIVAILAAIFSFSLFFDHRLSTIDHSAAGQILQAVAPAGWILVLCALAEFYFTLRLGTNGTGSPNLHFDWRNYGRGHYLGENLRRIVSNRVIWLSIVGLSIFWGISQVVLVAFPTYTKAHLATTSSMVIQGMMACTGVGIIVGSLAAGRASRHHIETGLVPLGALGIVLTLSLIPQTSSIELLGVVFLLLGMAGGLFTVPLFALIQFHADEGQLGRVLAGTNCIQGLVMLGLLVLAALYVASDLDSTGLFQLITVVALFGTLYTVKQLPQSLVRLIFSRIFTSTYRVRVLGLDNLPSQGGVLLLGNHISWLDWAIVQIACPRPIRFVMHRGFYERWYLKWFLDLFGVIPIARGQSKKALATINRTLNSGEVVCIFPEGAISRNGQLGEFKTGYLRAAMGAEGLIIPFYLRGLWGSRFSRSNDTLREYRSTGLRKDVIVAFGTPLPLDTPVQELKQQVFELSIDAWEQHTRTLDPIPLAWIRTARRRGLKMCLTDTTKGRAISGYQALASVMAISRLIRENNPAPHVGILLPASCDGISANLAVLLRGRTLVNLNYSAGAAALYTEMDIAHVHAVLTSGRFLSQLGLPGIDLQRLQERMQVIDIEDLGNTPRVQKLLRLLAAVLLPARMIFSLYGKQIDLEQPAAVIFTGGIEGKPKGVLLSHRNFMGNIRQIADVLDTRDGDMMMAILPLFHAYGLTVTGLMPMVEGIPVIFHENSMDAPAVAKAIARYQATILCATSSILEVFSANPRVHPLMLDSLRLVVAGAEPLSQEVRDRFKLKFNKEIYEGYGSTETAPVASVNIPDRIDPRDWQVQQGNRPGTVGMPLPGSSCRIVDPETLESLPPGENGLVLIGGAQVMLGYLDDPEKTAEVIVLRDGVRWHKTGDLGRLDHDGFLTIIDRLSHYTDTGRSADPEPQ